MIREELEEFLNKKGVAQEDKDLFVEFFKNITHSNRERMLGILVGHEDMFPIFLDILRKKKEYALTGDASLGEELLALEKQTLDKLRNE